MSSHSRYTSTNNEIENTDPLNSESSQAVQKKRKASAQSTLAFQPLAKKPNPDISQNQNNIPSVFNSGMASQPKKLVIKNLKVKPKLPENFEEQTWNLLQEAVRAIFLKKPVSCSLEELYKAVENLCSHKLSASIYSNLEKECEEHIKTEVTKLAGQAIDNLDYLTLLNTTWDDFKSELMLIRSIFLYLDRTYALNTQVLSIWDMGLHLFRIHIMTNPAIERKALTGILSLIKHDRQGESVDRSLLKNLLRMYSAIQLYAEGFEKAFLEATTNFYTTEAETTLQDLDVPEYLKHVEKRLQDETERVHHYLEPSTRKPLITVLETRLLKAHVEAIIAKGFDGLIKENRIEDLTRMYTLFSKVSGLDSLKLAWKEYIKKTGTEYVTNTEAENDLVQNLLDFYSNLVNILETAFASNKAYYYSMKEAFEHFINARQNKPAELIAKYVDQKLRVGGTKGMNEEELEAILERVITLFRYIQGKDVFEAFYKKDLAKRLLLGKKCFC